MKSTIDIYFLNIKNCTLKFSTLIEILISEHKFYVGPNTFVNVSTKHHIFPIIALINNFAWNDDLELE